MLIIYQFQKKNHTVIKTHLNTLLDIMIMMLLDRYAQMTGYARKFDENATISFIIKDKQIY